MVKKILSWVAKYFFAFCAILTDRQSCGHFYSKIWSHCLEETKEIPSYLPFTFENDKAWAAFLVDLCMLILSYLLRQRLEWRYGETRVSNYGEKRGQYEWTKMIPMTSSSRSVNRSTNDDQFQ